MGILFDQKSQGATFLRIERWQKKQNQSFTNLPKSKLKNSRMVSNSLICLVRVSFHGLNAPTLQDASVSTHWKNKLNCFWLVVMKKICQRRKIWPLNQFTSMTSLASCGVLLPLTLLVHMKTFTKV